VTLHVHRLLRIERSVSDLARAVAFYRDALGFTLVDETPMGGPGVRAHAAMLRLGEQAIELTAFDPPGRAYPAGSHAADLWFQHFAIVVADMEAAYERLCRHPSTAITAGGPQRLPPNTGSVTAFKFRDPDDHPLELIHFPSSTGDPAWQRRSGLFLGIDHSAIVVADVEKSLGFYTRLLGLDVSARSTNSGAAQARLDGLSAEVCVDVVALQPRVPGPPHIELLGYQRPSGRPFPADVLPSDILADRLVLEVGDLSQLEQRLEAGDIPFTPSAADTTDAGRRRTLTRDPTGHLLLFTQACSASS